MFKEYNQNQAFLLPPSILDYLGENHQAVLLNEIIEQLDLTKLYDTYKNKHWWTSAFHPKMLLKVVIYSYMTWTFSSRKIAKKLHSDLAFIYISGWNKPDFRTINLFREQRLSVIDDIFLQIVQTAKDMWMITFWTFNLDWTKMYANASKNKNNDLEWLDKIIKSLLDKANEIDELEDDKLGDRLDDLPEELQTKEWRKKKLQEIQDRLKQVEDKKKFVEQEIESKKHEWVNMKRINSTDKDSRLTQMKHKDFNNWYNTQVLSENQVIVSTYISNNSADTNELIPTMDKFYNENKWIENIQLCADKWYSSVDNYQYIEEKWIDWYISPHCELKVDLSKYQYNELNDEYIDNKGNIYVFKQYSWWSWKRWRPKKWEDKSIYKTKMYVCKNYEWKKKFLDINHKWQEYHKKYTKKVKSEKWKEVLKRRSVDVEPIFWDIKKNMWFETFSLRWLKNVVTEWYIVCIAHNIKKIINFQMV